MMADSETDTSQARRLPALRGGRFRGLHTSCQLIVKDGTEEFAAHPSSPS